MYGRVGIGATRWLFELAMPLNVEIEAAHFNIDS